MNIYNQIEKTLKEWKKDEAWRGYEELEHETTFTESALKKAMKELATRGRVMLLPIFTANETQYVFAGRGWFLA